MSSYCAWIESNSKPGIQDLPDLPNQPSSISFLKKSFGKKIVVECSFQATWRQKTMLQGSFEEIVDLFTADIQPATF